MSKRLGSLSTQSFRREITPEALTGRLAHLCGLTDRAEPITPRDLLPRFSWSCVRREDIPLPEISDPAPQLKL